MALQAICPSCKSQFEFGDEYAGRLLLCRNCKSTFSVPELPREESVADPAGVQRMMGASQGAQPAEAPQAEPPARNCYVERLTAGRICTFLGVLCTLSALVLGAATVFFSCQVVPAKAQPTWNMLAMILGGMAGSAVVLAGFYLICGSAIRDGGIFSTWIMLLLTGLQLISSLCGLGLQAVHYGDIPDHFPGKNPADPHTIYWTGVIVGFVFLLIYAKLFACLLRIVSAPRQRPEPFARRRAEFA